MTITKSILISQLLFLFACSAKNNHVIKREYYPDGNIKTETTYKGAVRDGKAFSYYENGRIKSEDTYVNGVENGIFKEYYVTGVLQVVGTFIYGTFMGSYYRYYPNGKLLGYNAKSYDGNTFYSIMFDSLGNKTYEEGFCVSPMTADYTGDTVHTVKDTIHLVWFIAEPPGYRNEIQMCIKKRSSNDSSEYKVIVPFKNISADRSIVDYKKTFHESGFYEIIIGSKLVDTSTKFIKTDSCFADFNIE